MTRYIVALLFLCTACLEPPTQQPEPDASLDVGADMSPPEDASEMSTDMASDVASDMPADMPADMPNTALRLTFDPNLPDNRVYLSPYSSSQEREQTYTYTIQNNSSDCTIGLTSPSMKDGSGKLSVSQDTDDRTLSFRSNPASNYDGNTPGLDKISVSVDCDDVSLDRTLAVHILPLPSTRDTPDQTSLKAWYRADSVRKERDKLTRWFDLTKGRVDAVPACASEIVYDDNDNNRPFLDMNQSCLSLESEGGPAEIELASNDFTVLVVAQIESFNETIHPFIGHTDQNNAIGLFNGKWGLRRDKLLVDNGPASTNLPIGQPIIFVAKSAGTQLTLDTITAENTFNQTLMHTNPTTLTFNRIGAAEGSAAPAPLSGGIYEVLVFDRGLPQSELDAVTTYLECLYYMCPSGT